MKLVKLVVLKSSGLVSEFSTSSSSSSVFVSGGLSSSVSKRG